MAEPSVDLDTDVVVVGSGGAGMVAALTARAAGLDVILIEKAGVFGGTTAMSGGGTWIPNAPAILRAGVSDDVDEVSLYLEKIAGDCVSADRRARYIEAAPQMMSFLEKVSPHLNKAFTWGSVPDYHQELGGAKRGRGIWPKPIDRRLLGQDEKLVRTAYTRLKGLPKGMWVTGDDLHEIVGIAWKGAGLTPYRALARLIWRMLTARILGVRIGANGAALITRLRLALRDFGVPLMLNTPLRQIIKDGSGRVIGVEVETEGQSKFIRARRGVVLATGGFENGEMRRQYQPVVGQGWSHGNPDNKGDGHLAALDVGAGLDLMDEAWWYPSIQLPGGLFALSLERKTPAHFVVNSKGERFANEAMDYNSFGALLVQLQKTHGNYIPVWFIMDEWNWRHNIFCGHYPGGPMPTEWLAEGHVRTADTMEELAVNIGVPPAALKATAQRFNGFARAGKDEDFGRGERAFDNYNADQSRKNPNLAELKQPPFYAFQIFPGDLGTKGGVITDVDARVLREDGSVISGLYAAGNVSASVMGRSYAGPGSTLGPAMTFAFVAARHLAASGPGAVSGEAQDFITTRVERQ